MKCSYWQFRHSFWGNAMTKIVQGKINGRTIQLSEDLGLSSGAEVEVQVRVLQPKRNWGEGIRRCAGALADDQDWDAVMEAIHQERKLERRPIPESE
jgi:hypothetical protein